MCGEAEFELAFLVDERDEMGSLFAAWAGDDEDFTHGEYGRFNGFENHCKIMEGRFYECASAAFILSWDG